PLISEFYTLSLHDALPICLFLFSTRKGIWIQLFQVRQQLIGSADFAGLVPHFWDVDVVQPRVRRRVANRSRSRVTGRNCSALFQDRKSTRLNSSHDQISYA